MLDLYKGPIDLENEKWTFESISPRFGIYGKDENLQFYEKLGFRVTYDDGGFIIVSRDSINIHMNVNNAPITRHVCWIGVKGIESLYETCLNNEMVRGELETKDYG